MSRTHKDRPWWLSEWYEPSHVHCINDLRYHIWYRAYKRDEAGRYLWDEGLVWHRREGFRTCDLPVEPRRGSRPLVWRQRYGNATISCYWEPIPDPDQNSSRYNFRSDREGRHAEWWGPDRCSTRDWLIEARKEYHGTGDVQDDRAPLREPRHGSWKGWW